MCHSAAVCDGIMWHILPHRHHSSTQKEGLALAQIGNKNIIGVTLHNIRHSRGLTQEQLCEMLKAYDVDICVSTLSKIESQSRRVADFELLAIANALDISVYDLVGASSKHD